MYENILIPVDGSEVSNHAAEEGFKLALKLGSKISLVYVVDYSLLNIPDAETAITNIEVLRRNFTEHGEKLLSMLEKSAKDKGLEVKKAIREGDVHDEIITAAEEAKAGLIIMGTHGRRGLNRLLLGSVAESVARRAHCAVLLIRPD